MSAAAYDTPEHAAQRAAWAYEDAAAQKAMLRSGKPLDGYEAILAQADRIFRSELDMSAVERRVRDRVMADIELEPKPVCPTERDIRAIGNWASAQVDASRRNAARIYAAMMADPEFQAVEAERQTRRNYIARAVREDPARGWMTPLERAWEQGRYGD